MPSFPPPAGRPGVSLHSFPRAAGRESRPGEVGFVSPRTKARRWRGGTGQAGGG